MPIAEVMSVGVRKRKKILQVLLFTAVTAALMSLIGFYGFAAAQTYRSKLDALYQRTLDAREEIQREIDETIAHFTTGDMEHPVK